MKKVHIWLFIISLQTPVYWTIAQELVEEVEEVVVDTLKKREKKPYTIRFGLDLSKPFMAQLDKDYFGLELVGDIGPCTLEASPRITISNITNVLE